jgi:hypothetical protein
VTYTQHGERVTLEITRDMYDQLLRLIGAGMATMAGDLLTHASKAELYRLLEFTNELNNGNPNYTPYSIPPEFEGHK